MQSISRTLSAIPGKLAAAYQWCSIFVFGRTVASVKPATHLNNIESCQVDASARKRKAESTELTGQPAFKHGRVETFSYSNDDKDEPGQSSPDKMGQSQSSKPEVSQNTNSDEVIIIDDSTDEPDQSPDEMEQSHSSKPEVNQNTNTDEVIVIDDSDDESADSPANETNLSLSATQWLGDKHLSAFVSLVKHNLGADSKDHFIFDPFFFTKLSKEPCTGSVLDSFVSDKRKTMTKSACLNYANIHIPVNVNDNHWILITVSRDEKKMTVFDSLHKSSESYAHLIEGLVGFFKAFDLDIKNVCFDSGLKQQDS